MIILKACLVKKTTHFEDFLHLLTKSGMLNREVQIGQVYEDFWPGTVLKLILVYFMNAVKYAIRR